MKDEALKLALEALLDLTAPSKRARAAITAIKQALAAPVQPVGWLEILRNNKTATDEVIGAFLRGHAEHLTEETFVLITPPAAQRQWVGLTDDEMHACWDSPLTPLGMKHARMIEAKLREKNT